MAKAAAPKTVKAAKKTTPAKAKVAVSAHARALARGRARGSETPNHRRALRRTAPPHLPY